MKFFSDVVYGEGFTVVLKGIILSIITAVSLATAFGCFVLAVLFIGNNL